MKHNYTERQYLQLAKEQFSRTFYAIPFVSDVDFVPSSEFLSMIPQFCCDFSAEVHFSDDRPAQRFCVDVKAKGEKRFVDQYISRVEKCPKNVQPLLMAPYLSERSADDLRAKNHSYIDLSGNCYIVTNSLFISVSGKPNQYIAERSNKHYFSKSASAASAIMRTMLDEPRRLWRVQELAEVSGKAIGSVSNVKRFLLDRAWIKAAPSGFRLCNIREMLYEWAKDYKKKDARTFEYYSLDSIPAIEGGIAGWNDAHGATAVLGSFAAAVRYAPAVRYKKVHVYVEQQDFDEFVRDLELQPVTSGGNVAITIPHDETPCMYSRNISGDIVTSPVQTVLDLLTGSGRGEEAADAVIQKEFGEW